MDIVNKIRQELKQNSEEKIRSEEKRFFKEKTKLHGVKTAITRKIGEDNFKLVKLKPKAEIFAICEQLWQSGYIEEAFIACHWSYFVRKDYVPEDFKLFEDWLGKYVSNWATCDTFCNHTVGEFLEKYPQFLPHLKSWAISENRWMRRGAAVSLIIPAKNGMFLKEIVEIADLLLLDQDDLVQKGYGWMLKAASQRHQEEVFEFVMKHKLEMPRTALRYAIEKMPQDLKTKAMN